MVRQTRCVPDSKRISQRSDLRTPKYALVRIRNSGASSTSLCKLQARALPEPSTRPLPPNCPPHHPLHTHTSYLLAPHHTTTMGVTDFFTDLYASIGFPEARADAPAKDDGK